MTLVSYVVAGPVSLAQTLLQRGAVHVHETQEPLLNSTTIELSSGEDRVEKRQQ